MDLADPKDKTILVVDDDESIRSVLEHVLTKDGFKVQKAGDGEQALEMVQSRPPDMILLDLMLPRYGGFEILRQLQARGHGKVPIVVITGRYADRSIAELILQESNVVDFMEKPLKMAALLGILHRTLHTLPPAIPVDSQPPTGA